MRKRSVRVSTLVIAVTVGVAVLGADAAPGPGGAVGVGASFVVEPPMARYVADLDPRELREQVRDWAVLATVTRLGATPEQAAAATYELPPARLPYLDELYAFEHGRGRRAYLGARVLLFRDADDRDPQATIGRLADRVREETGAIPAKVEVYLIHDQRDEGTIRIERAADATGAALFSPAYGYVEGKADSAAELGAWLARADDLSFAQLRGGHLVVGGRRFAKTRTLGLTTEDVAALYQAHEQLGAPYLAARRTIQAMPPAAQSTADRAVELLRNGKLDEAKDVVLALPRQVQVTSLEQWESIVAAVRTSASPVRSPAFSLDPEWLPDPLRPARPLMLDRLRTFVAFPCEAIAAIVKQAAALERAEPDPTRRTHPTQRALELRELSVAVGAAHGEAAVCRALKAFLPELDSTIAAVAAAVPSGWETALGHYYQLEARLLAIPESDPRALPAALTLLALRYHAGDSRTQCARYEGTAGTEVGMTMFYTDLLAKVWLTVDHGLSAPTLEVAGFVTQPRVEVPPALAGTLKENPWTRVWFGPRDGNVSRLEGDGVSILFDHSFTRIYAAGRDPARPGVEARPNEHVRRGIGWWDRHYDDVADHEQEFHRLNQIMKWSLVAGALSEVESARYLRTITVQRDREFNRWHRSHQARLRFTGSLPISSSIVAGKECLPILESYSFPFGGQPMYMFGGVAAAGLGALPRVSRVNLAKPLALRKLPAIDHGGPPTGAAARALARPVGKEVVFDHVAAIPTRDATRNIALGTPRVSFKAGARPGGLEVHAGDPARPIGVVAAERNGAGIQMSWRSGTVEQARYGGVPARSLAEADGLARSGDLLGAAPMFKQAGALAPSTVLARARDTVVHAAHRRPAAVQKALHEVAASGEKLSPAAQEMLVASTRAVGTPGAAAHVKHALSHQLPLANALGKIATERGKIVWTRDVQVLETTAARISPATDLATRHVYIDSRLRIGQEGLLPDAGGQAARWQQRPNVRMQELRQRPMGPRPDRIDEASTGAAFHYVPPSKLSPDGLLLPPILIRKCDASQQTQQTDDDC